MKLSELLTKQAEMIRTSSPEVVAVEMLKKAGFSDSDARAEVMQTLMEKEAASSLTQSGIDYDEALAMVKAAGIKVKDLASFKPEQTFEEILSDQLMKFASEAEKLETQVEQGAGLIEKVAELEGILEHTPQNEELPTHISKFAESGNFTNADLDALMKLPSETLTKIATSQEQPWSMGKSAGTRSISSDPLLEFLTS
jgi:uncharacterized protein YjhX (UPF0386 family)